MKKSLCVVAAVFAAGFVSSARAAVLVTFDDLSLPPNSFYNGGPVTNSAGWTSGGVTFGNSFNSSFGGFWNGFSHSNVNNTTTPGFMNQYAAYTGVDVGSPGGSGIYAVAYSGSHAFVNLPGGMTARSVFLTNTTYAALSMRDGDMFAKKFGGASGNDPDFFDVIITGFDGPGATGLPTGSVSFRLADYTFADNTLDYILDTWAMVDLTPLGGAVSMKFSWESSDVGMFGINTPTYVALDNLLLVPEASALLSAFLGAGMVLRRRR